MLYVSFCPYSSVSIRPRHLASLFNKTSHSVKFVFGTMCCVGTPSFFFFALEMGHQAKGTKFLIIGFLLPIVGLCLHQPYLLSDKEIHASSFIFYQCYSIIGRSRVFPSDACMHLCGAGSGSLLF